MLLFLQQTLLHYVLMSGSLLFVSFRSVNVNIYTSVTVADYNSRTFLRSVDVGATLLKTTGDRLAKRLASIACTGENGYLLVETPV